MLPYKMAAGYLAALLRIRGLAIDCRLSKDHQAFKQKHLTKAVLFFYMCGMQFSMQYGMECGIQYIMQYSMQYDICNAKYSPVCRVQHDM